MSKLGRTTRIGLSVSAAACFVALGAATASADPGASVAADTQVAPTAGSPINWLEGFSTGSSTLNSGSGALESGSSAVSTGLDILGL
ncbi:hypothetical protein ACL02S_08610 [Nocardia sp. 004]|uniref:hypothetical protein n=1 Tax=Nocardia sp. 004 TaxID=3385978 RepID=UPI00399F8F79